MALWTMRSQCSAAACPSLCWGGTLALWPPVALGAGHRLEQLVILRGASREITGRLPGNYRAPPGNYRAPPGIYRAPPGKLLGASR